jgi:hypothetical protein
MKLARVFPRFTKATPRDRDAYVGEPGLFETPGTYERVSVSVTFTWDRGEGERLADAWRRQCDNVHLGGPAFGDPGGEFVPGRYLQEGHVITSRGCPGRCWFCDVPQREGPIRELPIADGWIVQDSNLLACSREHIEAVFAMLGRQKHRAQFVGGLEAARLRDWHVHRLAGLSIESVFTAYDDPRDLEAVRHAGKLLQAGGIRRRYCHVLVGYNGDTWSGAERRCRDAAEAGFLPRAMLYRDPTGWRPKTWIPFARRWHRPAIVRAMLMSA